MKVLILGLGGYEKGSGITAAKFYISNGAEVIVTDLKTRHDLSHQVKSLMDFAKKNKQKTPKFVLGKHKESDVRWADIVVRNPGVPKNSKLLKLAKKLEKEVETDISLFFKNVNTKNIIAVTGTRGKSTTATLIYKILGKKYKRIWIGGNIKISPLSFVNKVRLDDVVILELSSWMLEDFKEKGIAPHIAVVTNIYPDHLNSYRNIAEYIKAKKNIFASQKKTDYLILNYDNKETRSWKFGFKKKVGDILELEGRGEPKLFYFTKKTFKKNGAYIEKGIIKIRRSEKINNVCFVDNLQLRGEHNLENILAAVTVSKIMGVPCAKVCSVLGSFRGVEDRQETVKKSRGIIYINDTTATTPEACIAALKTFNAEYKNIILIAGGKDKGLKYKELSKKIKKYCKAVILFSGTATDKILKELKTQKFDQYIKVENMKDAVDRANNIAEKGEVILLSPAAASFGLFKNEFDRGEQFKKIVTYKAKI